MITAVHNPESSKANGIATRLKDYIIPILCYLIQMTKPFPNLFKLLKSGHCQGYKNTNTNKGSDKYKKRCSAA